MVPMEDFTEDCERELPWEESIQSRFAEGLTAFLNHLSVSRNLSPHTLRAYQADLAMFLEWLPNYQAAIGPSNSEHTLFLELPSRFIGHLNSLKLSKTSITRKGSSLKTFFKFLMKERYFEEGVLPILFHRPKQPRRLPEFLSADEIQQLIQAIEKEPLSPLRSRNLAIIHTLFSSGIRIGELTALNWEHINWEQAELRIQGKGGRERLSFVSQTALQALRSYSKAWSMLSEKKQQPESPFFLNRDGDRLNVRSIRRMLSEFGEHAGLTKALHPHVFRHSFATHLLNHGVDLRFVQELLGHISIRSTQIYTHVSTERLKRAYLQAHPRAHSEQI